MIFMRQVADSIIPMIQTEETYPSEYESGMMPILDVQVKIGNMKVSCDHSSKKTYEEETCEENLSHLQVSQLKIWREREDEESHENLESVSLQGQDEQRVEMSCDEETQSMKSPEIQHSELLQSVLLQGEDDQRVEMSCDEKRNVVPL